MAAWLYVFFLLFVAFMLILDLGVFHRHSKEIGVREALGWTAFWVSLALLFVPVVYLIYSHHWFGVGTTIDPIIKRALGPIEACKVFIAGYLVEESLSLDNVFVIAVVLSFFGVPGKYQHRVLFWGIIGAVVLRGVMIGAGSVLVAKFQWMNYVFGSILVYTAYKMFASSDEEVNLENNSIVRFTRKFFPVTNELHGEKFFIRHLGKILATPLFLVLVIVDILDVVFAVDSIPAIFSITGDPFLVFTSNIFAILGLRSLYFALAALIKVFQYLKFSLVFLLGFLGIKMLITHKYHISIGASLGVILAILGCGVIASLVLRPKNNETFSSESNEACEGHEQTSEECLSGKDSDI